MIDSRAFSYWARDAEPERIRLPILESQEPVIFSVSLKPSISSELTNPEMICMAADSILVLSLSVIERDESIVRAASFSV